ncbi:hypothetical protein [Sphingomonas sp. GB1N7]|uniref:hypothetical protein n=1 Tax=Parasphingomonas caseinilytica TaxID=3096158 RepID=UPI002FCA4C8B
MSFSRSVIRLGIAAGLLALAACSPIESRTRDGLIRAGLSPKLATCMAKPMSEQLSVAQLRKLASLGESGESHGRKHLLKRIRALDDPQIISVTTTAAALCSLGLD